MSEAKQVDVLGIRLDALRMPQVVERCRQAIERRTPLMIGVVNAAKVVKMREDAALRQAVTSCGLVLADGMAVVWASRLLGRPLPERIAGIDLFQLLLGMAGEMQASVYFLGAKQEVLEAVLERVRQEHPRLRIAGARNGYFSDAEAEGVAAEIRASQADMLFIAMSPPKKEMFLARWGLATGVFVGHGVGGSFDVYAGRTKRAPAWMQNGGLEWFYRVLQEPGRLWYRYLSSNLAFSWLVMSQWTRNRLGLR